MILMKTGALTMDVRAGEKLLLEDGEQCISVELIEKSGRFARLRVTAPLDVGITKESIDGSPTFGRRSRSNS